MLFPSLKSAPALTETLEEEMSKVKDNGKSCAQPPIFRNKKEPC